MFFFSCSGAIGARLSVDAANVRRLLGDTLALMVQCLSTLLTGFIVAMVASWRLALIITVVIPLVGFQGYAQIKFMKGYSADAKVMSNSSVYASSVVVVNQPLGFQTNPSRSISASMGLNKGLILENEKRLGDPGRSHQARLRTN